MIVFLGEMWRTCHKLQRSMNVIRLNSCPLGRPINCPLVGFFPRFETTKQQQRILRFDAYPRHWSSLGTITCPLVQSHKKRLPHERISERIVSEMRQNEPDRGQRIVFCFLILDELLACSLHPFFCPNMPIIQELDFRNPYSKNASSYRFNSD